MLKNKGWLVVSLMTTIIFLGACGQSEAKNKDDDDEEKVYKSTLIYEDEAGSINDNASNSSNSNSTQNGRWETVEQGGLKLTLHSVRETTQGRLEAENDKFIIASITIENIGDEDRHISSIMNFVLFDSNDSKQKHTISPRTTGDLEGNLPIGSSLKGEIAFGAVESDVYDLSFSLLGNSRWVGWYIKDSDL